MHESPNSSEGRRDRRRFTPPPAELGKLFERLPPHSPEAEMALLGSMLLDPQVIPGVLDWVKGPEAFYNEAHGSIYRAVVELYDRNASLDLVQTLERLRDGGVLDRVGGPDYLVELVEGVPSAVNAPHFARLVSEKHRLRSLINAAGEMLYEAYHAGELGPDGVREVLDKAQTALFSLADDPGQTEAQKLADLLFIEQERLEQMEGKPVSGVASGYVDLDKLTSGMQGGELLILAARPSMGKTALALNLAEQIAMGGDVFAKPGSVKVPVAIFSLEMSKSALTQRLLSARSGVDLQKLRSGSVGSDWQALNRACGELHETPMYIDDAPGLTILQLRARARRMAQQYGIKCIIIDYLQLLTAPGAARESRQVEVSTISRGIKALAREMNVPVICLAQLNRGTEQREGNRPRMSDLRESGSIEQDADVVMLLHREEYYHRNDPGWLEENPDKVGVAELIIAKQRNGPTGVVKLVWDSKTTRFKNHDPFHGEMDPFVESKPRITHEAPQRNGGYSGGQSAGYSGGYSGGNGGGGKQAGSSGLTAGGGWADSDPFEIPSDPARKSGAPTAGGSTNAGGGSGYSFAPGAKSGPISDHRDGGGPDDFESSWDDDYVPPPLPMRPVQDLGEPIDDSFEEDDEPPF